MKEMLTANEVGKEVGLTGTRIVQLAKDGTITGRMSGSRWRFPHNVIEVIRARPETRGRKKKNARAA